MKPMLEGCSELDLIDDFLRQREDVGDLAAYLPCAEVPLDTLPVEPPRASIRQFDPHFLNMVDLKNYSGPFNFEVSVAELVNHKRGKPYVYTPELSRLYSVSVEPVAFAVKASPDIPNDCVVYVFPIYSDQRFRAENVVTCDYHSTAESSEQPFCGKVFLRAGSGLNVNYVTLGNPARDVLQFSLPPNPANHQVIPLKFMCRNSCQGGINRRATKLVLVLCNSSNDTLGVSVIDFRIVSVPSRDSARDVQRVQGLPPKIKVMTTKKPRSETEGASSDSEEYVIRIRGALNYRVLKAAAEGLELRRKLRKDKKPKLPDTPDFKA